MSGIKKSSAMTKIAPLGIALVLVVGGAVGYNLLTANHESDQQQVAPQNLTEVKGFGGGEKLELMNDPAFAKIAAQKGISVKYQKAGSLEMVKQGFAGDRDFLAPSSLFAATVYKEQGGKSLASDTVLNTPIVFYSFKDIADKMVAAGVASKESDGSYSVDMQKFTQAQADSVPWSAWGITDLYGSVNVQTTDPNTSNSGNMVLALQAAALNNNQQVGPDSVDAVSKKLHDLYKKVGYSPSSSSDLFNQMIHQGKGANPVTAGYESQIIEFAIQHQSDYAKVKDDIVIMYPTPTIWSSHVIISLDDKGKKLSDLMLDPEVQRLAWESHGFRTGSQSGQGSEQNKLPVAGIKQQVTKVMQPPRPEIMEKLMAAVQ